MAVILQDSRSDIRYPPMRFCADGSRTLPPVAVGGAMGLINAFGNLGGDVGPYLGSYLQQVTGNFLGTAIVLSGSLLAALIVIMTITIRSIPQPIRAKDIAKLHARHSA